MGGILDVGENAIYEESQSIKQEGDRKCSSIGSLGSSGKKLIERNRQQMVANLRNDER